MLNVFKGVCDLVSHIADGIVKKVKRTRFSFFLGGVCARELYQRQIFELCFIGSVEVASARGHDDVCFW